MSEAFQLHTLIEEIIEDEKASVSKTKKISQADITRMLAQRQTGRKDGAAGPSISSKELEATAQAVVQDSTAKEGEATRSIALPSPGSRIFQIPEISGSHSQGAPNPARPAKGPQIFGTWERFATPSSLIPPRIALKHRVIPLHWGNRVIHLAMENPGDCEAIYDVEVLTGMRIEPVKVEPEWMDDALHQLADARSPNVFHHTDVGGADHASILGILLEMLVILDGSDLLLSPGVSPRVKIPTHWETLDYPPLSVVDCIQTAKSLMTERQWERFLETGSVVVSWETSELGRIRAHVYKERKAPTMLIRHSPGTLPPLIDLGLSPWFENLVESMRGLLLIAGPPGQGKTTTLHALVHEINVHRSARVVVLEDPVEFTHESLKAHISQREIGKDTPSFVEGIKHAWKTGSDVIALGELEPGAALREALGAAQAGHLVLATFEAFDALSALERMAEELTGANSHRGWSLLDDGLLGIVAQRLLAIDGGTGVLPVCEKLIWSPRIRQLVHSTPLGSLRNGIQGEHDDFISFQTEMLRLADEGRIAMEAFSGLQKKGH